MSHVRRSGLSTTKSLALAGLLAMGAVGAASIGQDVHPDDSMRMPARPALHAFEFAGGDLGDFIETLQSQWPDSNIMLDARAASFAVPAMALPKVTPSSLLDMVGDLRGTCDGQEWRCMVTEFPVQPGVKLYRIDGRPVSGRQAVESIRRIEVMSIATLLQRGYSVQQVRSSIEGVLDAAGFEPASYTIHVDETTSLLAVHGALEVTDATAAVLDSIAVSAQYRPLQLHDAADAPEGERSPS